MSNSNIQFFDWGQVEWVYEPDAANSFNLMNIGIYTILPGKKQKKHIHYGDEQVLYVLSGKGEQTIGETAGKKEAGSIFHIEPGSAHETVNTGSEPLMELVISIPANYENNLLLKKKLEPSEDSAENLGESVRINDELANIYDSFANSLKIPVSIFDKDGNVLIEGKGFPALCESKCGISKNIRNCCLYGIQDKYSQPQYSDPTAFICPYGLSVIIMSIVCNGEVIGIVKGGHIRLTPNIDDPVSGDQFFSKASVKAVLQQFKKLNKFIENYYVLRNSEIELSKKEETIQYITQHELILEELLKSTQEKVLNIRMNNHFLFNTLNAIASLAVKEKAFKTYESVINLSQMFRYTLKNDSNFVTLKDEIDYLGNYVQLQMLRYGDKLKVVFDIPEEMETLRIPFNCLQPILENSFIHGFKNKKDNLFIGVYGKANRNGLLIQIVDNGEGMDANRAALINQRVHAQNKEELPSGLMMIYEKFKLLYKEKTDIQLLAAPDQGTTVQICIPAQ